MIEDWLRADAAVPRKQRHTARRMWQRLVEEHGAEVSERQVDRYVAAARRRLGEVEAFVPLVVDAGAEAEVDWGQAQVILRSDPVKVHVFLMRACHSGASFAMAFRCETQQAFLEGHVRAFDWFEGVFPTLRYDNLGSAVAQMLKGRPRVECDRFVALRSHYMFESVFCIGGKRSAHEKGGVENEIGRFRRRHLVPVPKVGSMSELNENLEEACWRDLDRTIVGRGEPVGAALERERRLLGTLRRQAHCTALEATPRVDSKAMVSVPQPVLGAREPGRAAGARADRRGRDRYLARRADRRLSRLAGKHETSVQLAHYLDLLERKPGALARSLALRQERDRGDWSDCFDELWGKVAERSGREEAARQMVDVLMLCRELGPETVNLAVAGALAAGAHDGRAVALLAHRRERDQAPVLQVEERLAGIGSPPPVDLSGYDQLREARR